MITPTQHDFFRTTRARAAFTLVEMLVVMTIISILLAGGAAVMRSGTQASSARTGGDLLQGMVDQARAAAIGRGTEARLLIANQTDDDDRYLHVMMVVAAEVEDAGTASEKWVWRPVGEPKELPGGVYYTKGLGDTMDSAGNIATWDPVRGDAPAGGTSVEFGKALVDDGYGNAGSWISLAFDGSGRVANDNMTVNPILAVNLGEINGTSVTVPGPYEKYAEGVMVVLSTGRPVRLEETFTQANF